MIDKSTLDYFCENLAEDLKEKILGNFRDKVTAAGFRFMHRRNGRFWLMFDAPLSLNAIQEIVAHPDSALLARKIRIIGDLERQGRI